MHSVNPRIERYSLRLPGFGTRQNVWRQEQTEPEPPASDAPPIPAEEHRETVEKLDRIIDGVELALHESRKARNELPGIRQTLDLILKRMERAPNPLLGPPPTAPMGTRTKRRNA